MAATTSSHYNPDQWRRQPHDRVQHSRGAQTHRDDPASCRSQGDKVTVLAQVYNTLSTEVTVNATSITNPVYGPCEQEFATGVEVYQGDYTAGNSNATGARLFLYNPSLIYTCPTVSSYQYAFSPNSDIASRAGAICSVSETSVLAGYWTGSGQSYAFQAFLPGIYTVEVFDAWGQVAVGHFQVSGISLQSFALCASNCVYPSPYLTGQIHFAARRLRRAWSYSSTGPTKGASDMA